MFTQLQSFICHFCDLYIYLYYYLLILYDRGQAQDPVHAKWGALSLSYFSALIFSFRFTKASTILHFR